MEYIAGKREEGCVFCTKPLDRASRRENAILHVGKLAFVILNRYPYQSAHVMVIPLRHTDAFESLSLEESMELFRLLQMTGKVLREVYRAEGLNIGMNLGQCAGAGIREHLHFHMVPRWVGDTNFFPLLAGTRSMPELIAETYDRLRPAYRALESSGQLSPGGHDEPEAMP
jgi:ATP adenylyltransferase